MIILKGGEKKTVSVVLCLHYFRKWRKGVGRLFEGFIHRTFDFNIGHSFEKGHRKKPIEQHGLCQSSGLTGYHFMINLKGGGQVKRLL